MPANVIPFPRRWLAAYRLFWNDNFDRLTSYLGQLTKQENDMDNLKVEAPADQPIIIITRTLKAPRALVWKVWTDPAHASRWWGAGQGVTTIHKMDVRPGGEWRFQGGSMVFYGRYLEVDGPGRLVNTFGIEGMYPDDGLVESHAFEERDGVTHYTSTSRFLDMQSRDGMLASGMEPGARTSMNELEAILAELQR